MLLQSQWTEERGGKYLRVINLLPALPKKWPSGSADGLCTRDGFVVNIEWEQGALKRVVVHSKLGKPCLVRYGEREIVLQTQTAHDYAFDGKLQALHAD